MSNLKEMIKNEPVNEVNGVRLGKYYITQFGMEYEKKGEAIKVASTPLEDFKIINNGVRSDIYEFEFKGRPKYRGTYKEILNQLVPQVLSGIGNIGKDFVSDIIFHNHERVEYEQNGGYVSIDDIKDYELSEERIQKIQKFIVDYISENFSEEILVAFKLLLLFPFHYIIKEDGNVNHRGLVKGLSMYGVAGAGKSLISLLVLNMFNKELIKSVNTYSTVAGLTNDIVHHVGMIVADDCNDLFLKDPVRMDDLNKNIVNTEVPSKTKSDGETVTHDKYTSTPVYTSNDKPDFKVATLERIDVIHCLHPVKPPLFKLKAGKRMLLEFGLVVANTFKKNYQDIVDTEDSVKASNLLLERLPFDTTRIIEAERSTTPSEDLLPLNILFKQYIQNNIGVELNRYNFDKAIRVIRESKYYYKDNKDETAFYINIQQFYNFLRQITDDTSRDFRKEVNELDMKKTTLRKAGKIISAFTIKWQDLENWIVLDEWDETIEKNNS